MLWLVIVVVLHAPYYALLMLPSTSCMKNIMFFVAWFGSSNTTGTHSLPICRPSGSQWWNMRGQLNHHRVSAHPAHAAHMLPTSDDCSLQCMMFLPCAHMRQRYVFGLCVCVTKKPSVYTFISQMSSWKQLILLAHLLCMSPEMFARSIESYREY